MQKAIAKFFQDNPEATEVHVALGFTCNSYEDAEEFLKGVHGETVQTITKEDFDDMQDEAEEPGEPEETLEITLSKRDSKGIQELINVQVEVVKEKQAAWKEAKGAAKQEAKKVLEAEVEKLEGMSLALNMRLEEEAEEVTTTPEATTPEATTPEATTPEVTTETSSTAKEAKPEETK